VRQFVKGVALGMFLAIAVLYVAIGLGWDIVGVVFWRGYY
jgi:hypothetical protein